jgi:hypothetical protein
MDVKLETLLKYSPDFIIINSKIKFIVYRLHNIFFIKMVAYFTN